MPDKDGDEGKSTKSVVNKKQKQMMGEEGYDVARDMGRVRSSKDKKDATTMPPSKEMEKTRKVNKGPSAFELVKNKYGKSVMNVGKKKANEELDLTQVAESFGGYIVEARRAKRIPNASGGKKTGSLRGGDIEFPGDRTGATQQAKADIEARKGFKGSKSGGLKDDERNPYVKREVRRSRVDDLGGDIFDQPKFTQKGFEKSLKDVKKAGKKGRDAQSQALKDIAASDPEGVSRPDEVKKEPFKKPEDPFKTSKSPIGSIVKNFKFAPRDISTQQAAEKTAKSFKQFSQDLRKAGLNIQDYKDRDIATMRTGPSPSRRIKPDITGTGGRNRPRVTGDVETRQDVGMAPPDEPRKPRVKNPSYNQFLKYADQATADVNRLNKERDAIRDKGNLTKDDTLKIRDLNKQIQGAQAMAKDYTAQSTLQIIPNQKVKNPIVAVSGNERIGQNPTDRAGREIDFAKGKESSGRETRSGAYLRGLRKPSGSSSIVQEPKGASIIKKSFDAYGKLAKANPALGGVAGIAAYDIGKGVLGKVKKYTKAITQSLNVRKSTGTGRISAGT